LLPGVVERVVGQLGVQRLVRRERLVGGEFGIQRVVGRKLGIQRVVRGE